MWPFSTTTDYAPSSSTTSGSSSGSVNANANANANANTNSIPESACPVDHSTRSTWSTTTGSASLDRTRGNNNQLSTYREISSIPRWLPPNSSSSSSSSSSPIKVQDDPSIPPSACPAHSKSITHPPSNLLSSENTVEQENWVYPSPSSFYSALQRKDRPANPQDMPIVVPIHNAVNEKVWNDVLEWERLALGKQGKDKVGSKLVSFVGKPKELSPRARWKSFIGYTPPFDRHDWIVDRPLSPTAENPNPGSIRVRYVIDFYTGKGAGLLQPDNGTATSSATNNPTSRAADQFMRPNLAFFIDCRPALDGFEGFRMRFDKFKETWLGSTRTESQR